MTVKVEVLQIPRQTRSDLIDRFDFFYRSSVYHLEKAWKKTEINPESIRSIAQFGPGIGSDSAAFLTVFPCAHIDLIDYYDDLHPTLKNNQRVTFHQGLFVDVLEEGGLPQADLTVIANVGHNHGFNEDTIHLLERAVGAGYLLTDGDTGILNGAGWFCDKFTMIMCLDSHPDMMLWQAKNPNLT